jgi:hypothetical protein
MCVILASLETFSILVLLLYLKTLGKYITSKSELTGFSNKGMYLSISHSLIDTN